jgi:leucyl aminopeptidase (aminopeptidase T)
MNDLDRAVQTVVRRCLAVQAGEDVVVVVDEPLQALGEKLRDAAQAVGAEGVLTVMSPRATDGSEPPAPVAEALAASDVFIAPASRSLSHTLARKRASEGGARGATMPHVTTDMLARLMAVDFDRLRERSHAVAQVLDRGAEAHITCPRGTDLRLELSGRQGIADDGDLTAPGSFGNLPCGEGFIAPIEGATNGRLVVDGSIAGIGRLGEPVRLRVEDGHLQEASGEEGARLMELLTAHGADGTNVAELGIGTNEKATLTGEVLEDEKILGSAHVAFGASAAIGGTVQVPVHLDCVVTGPEVSVDGKPIVRDGELLVG